jgi:hypothetical protein
MKRETIGKTMIGLAVPVIGWIVYLIWLASSMVAQLNALQVDESRLEHAIERLEDQMDGLVFESRGNVGPLPTHVTK